MQVVGDVGIVVGVDDGDRRAAAVAGHGAVVEGDLVEAVGVADLRRRIPGRAGRHRHDARVGDAQGHGVARQG